MCRCASLIPTNLFRCEFCDTSRASLDLHGRDARAYTPLGVASLSGPLNGYNVGGDFSMASLASKTCVPCRGGVPALKGKELETLHRQVPQWQVVEEHHLNRTFTFPDFKQALDFVNRVGALAEEQGHHPDIMLAWGKAEITLWTHKINGLTESDFIMAAKIDALG
jgi:4a-hydroxytetrahydrobiopterin dehydratase